MIAGKVFLSTQRTYSFRINSVRPNSALVSDAFSSLRCA